MSLEIKTNPEEFRRFHCLLTKQNPNYHPYYFALNSNRKDPIEGVSWKAARLSFEDALDKMQRGFNIGIAGTDTDNLVIIDIDDLKKVNDSKPTLITKSRKRIGMHCFYFSEDEKSDNIFVDSAKQNIATEKCGEVRSSWQYVVVAGSYVPVDPQEKDDDGNLLMERLSLIHI